MATEQELQKAREQIREHINLVREQLIAVHSELERRIAFHDETKLKEPELSIYAEYIPKLASSTYGSDEYKEMLKGMKPALDHHYALNRHHPEYFDDGVEGMNLIDLLEMVCDWMAAVKKHDNGDIRKSLEINKERFGISDQLSTILANTVDFLEERVTSA